MDDEEFMERLVRLETIVGDDKSGIQAEIARLRQLVESLKDFQTKVLAIFGLLTLALQIAMPLLLSHVGK